MPAAETVAGLAGFERRGAGTDSERRAAAWLAAELERAGQAVEVQPFWCRPNWALAHAWHVALALAGSLVSVHHARVGGALILAALVFVILDERLGLSPGRRLTPERASQNVVGRGGGGPRPGEAPRRASTSGGEAPPVRLILTANYDAGRSGLAYRDRLRAPAAKLNQALGGWAPGWIGWVVIALAWLLAVAILRLEGDGGSTIGVIQLIPTVALVLTLAVLLELAGAAYGPAANDNGSGVATAIALASALRAAPPSRLRADVVLTGAGDVCGIGLRRYLRRHRRELKAAGTVVIGIAACGAGCPRWWLSDGQLVPMRYFKRLRELCEQIAAAGLGARPHRGRGAASAFPARGARLPAIAIGCLGADGRVPRSHQGSDTADKVDLEALDSTLEFGLLLVDAIDAFLRERRSDGRDRIALRRPFAVLGRRQREPADQLRA